MGDMRARMASAAERRLQGEPATLGATAGPARKRPTNRDQLERAGVHEDDTPTHLKCPISLCVMDDPVVAADGHTYERACIEEWFAMGKRTSPQTNETLTSTALTPAHTIRGMVDDWNREEENSRGGGGV